MKFTNIIFTGEENMIKTKKENLGFLSLLLP